MSTLIVGAGPTGLGAATRLHQHGRNDWLLIDQVSNAALHTSLDASWCLATLASLGHNPEGTLQLVAFVSGVQRRLCLRRPAAMKQCRTPRYWGYDRPNRGFAHSFVVLLCSLHAIRPAQHLPRKRPTQLQSVAYGGLATARRLSPSIAHKLSQAPEAGGLACTDVTPQGFLFDMGGHVIFRCAFQRAVVRVASRGALVGLHLVYVADYGVSRPARKATGPMAIKSP